jgi:hypothetical protein
MVIIGMLLLLYNKLEIKKEVILNHQKNKVQRIKQIVQYNV